MRSLPIFLLTILVAGSLPFSFLRAEEHVVTPADLQKALSEAASKRHESLAKIDRFLSQEPVQNALNKTGLGLSKIEHAIPQLNDEELARLAAQVDRIQADVTAGSLTNEQLTYIVIALATAVIILVIVAA